jgi:transcriptional antiterminator RfaH
VVYFMRYAAAPSQGDVASNESPASNSRWYLAQTQPRAECKASVNLRRQGFEIYLPRYLKQRRHARRVEPVMAPLFPGYLFVAIDINAQRWLSIDSTFGVTRLVRDGDRPAVVPLAIITALRCREDAKGLVVLDHRPRFSPGDKVRVLGGAFRDCYGLYEGMSSGERVAILLDLLGRKVRVVLHTDIIEAA